MPPVVAGIATVFTAIGFSASTAAMLAVTTLVSGVMTGINFVARAIVGTPKIQSPTVSQDLQSRQVTVRQAITAWTVAYGESRIGGVIVAIFQTGASKEYLHFVIVHCSGECEDLPAMQFDGEDLTFDANGDATGKYAGYVHWEKRLGTEDQAVYAGLITATNGQWTENDRGLGHCHSWVRLKRNTDLFPNGVPKMTWTIKGRKVYDPRTKAVAYSNNFALCLRDYVAQPRYGLGATADELNEAANGAAANLSDEDVPLKAGGTEKRYTMDGSFSVDKAPNEIIPDLLTAGWGNLIYSAGQWGIYPAAWREPVLDLSDKDFRGAVQLDARIRRSEIFNGVKGTYVSPVNSWQATDFPAFMHDADREYAQDDYLIEDGERIWTDITLPYTTSPARAQRIGKIVLEAARLQKTLRAPCFLKAFKLQVPLAATITHPRFAFEDKAFKTDEWRLVKDTDSNNVPYLGVDLVLRETKADVYAWSIADEKPVENAPSVTLPDASSLEAPTGLVAERINASSAHISWSAPADAAVLEIVCEYREEGSARWISAGRTDSANTDMYIYNLESGIAYEAQAWSVGNYGVTSEVVTCGIPPA